MNTFTILLYTLLMMGITFIVGFAVAGLIKMMTNMLAVPQNQANKTVAKMPDNYANEHIRLLRLMALSEPKEMNYTVFQYLCSRNLHKKKQDAFAERFDYTVSHNPKEEERKLPEVFDFLVSHNN